MSLKGVDVDPYPAYVGVRRNGTRWARGYNMFENNYASIGKSVLIRAIGLQDNYRVTNELDRKMSGCFSCPHLKRSLKNPSCSECSSCTAKRYLNDSYVNEKNRYGYQPALPLCSLKLFTYLHFFVTGLGVVENLRIRAAAERLSISQRSVHNSLHLLKEHGYIDYVKNKPGSYLVVLNEYSEYFKKANEGGRGYVVLNKDFLEEAIIASEGINELRLHFRMYLNVDGRKNALVTPENYLTDSQKITSMCRYFPHYVKPVHVRHLMSKVSSVFEIRQNEDTVVYSLRRNLCGDLQKSLYRSTCQELLEDLITDWEDILNGVFFRSASLSTVPLCLTQQVVDAKLHHGSFRLSLSDKDFEDLVSLAVQYGYDLIARHLEELLAGTKQIQTLSDHYGEYIRYAIEQELCAA